MKTYGAQPWEERRAGGDRRGPPRGGSPRGKPRCLICRGDHPTVACPRRGKDGQVIPGQNFVGNFQGFVSDFVEALDAQHEPELSNFSVFVELPKPESLYSCDRMFWSGMAMETQQAEARVDRSKDRPKATCEFKNNKKYMHI